MNKLILIGGGAAAIGAFALLVRGSGGGSDETQVIEPNTYFMPSSANAYNPAAVNDASSFDIGDLFGGGSDDSSLYSGFFETSKANNAADWAGIQSLANTMNMDEIIKAGLGKMGKNTAAALQYDQSGRLTGLNKTQVITPYDEIKLKNLGEKAKTVEASTSTKTLKQSIKQWNLKQKANAAAKKIGLPVPFPEIL